MKIHAHIIAGIAIGAVLSTAHGDVLSLARGDVLHGVLRDLSDGIAVFDTGIAGQVVVPVAQIRSLTTDNVFEIELEGGKRVKGRFVGQNNATRIVPGSGGEGDIVQLAAVHSIAPVGAAPGPEAGDITAHSPPLDLSWEGGYLRRWGNRDYGALYTRLTLQNRVEAFEFYSENLLEISGEESFPRLFRSASEWRFPTSGAFHPELGLELERDLDDALEFRGGLNAGFTRVFLNEPDRLFKATGGLNIAFEFYDAEHLWPDTAPALRHRIGELYYDAERRREENQELNLRLRLRLRRMFIFGALAQTVTIYPSISEFGELRGRSESAFRMPVTSQLNFRMHLFLDYETEPEFRRMDNWRTSIGAGFEWDF